MSQTSSPELLTLHAVRVLGFADTGAVARRFDLDAATVDEHLLDAHANGWLTHTAFAGTAGWSLTDRGRSENERQLAAELVRTGHADDVRDAYEVFVLLNGLVLRAVTDWQLRPQAGNRLAPNDHADPTWDQVVLTTLHGINDDLRPLVGRLAAVLTRFSGYATRFGAALTRARAGNTAWVDRTDVDSCHRVWFELHEDLVATLGHRP
ncbi:MAG: transcriptional regulator [Pseudonocardia sp.]|nr:transcriptional regulator [Pseudonocardia sp.]